MATKTKGAKKSSAKKSAKAAKATRTSTNERANGEIRPREGGKTARVWEIADTLSKKLRRPATRAEVLEVAVGKEKASQGMASTQYGRWRRFNGLFGRTASEGGTRKAAAKKAAPVKAAKKGAKGAKKAAARKRAPKAPSQAPAAPADGGDGAEE